MRNMRLFFRRLLSDQGDLSMTRFLSMICVFTACGIAVYTLYKGQAGDSIVGLVSTFLAAGFGGKVVQRFAESKEPNVEVEELKDKEETK